MELKETLELIISDYFQFERKFPWFGKANEKRVVELSGIDASNIADVIIRYIEGRDAIKHKENFREFFDKMTDDIKENFDIAARRKIQKEVLEDILRRHKKGMDWKKLIVKTIR